MLKHRKWRSLDRQLKCKGQQETLSWAAVAGVMRSAILGTHCMTVIISLLTLWIILNKSCSEQPLQSMSQVTWEACRGIWLSL